MRPVAVGTLEVVEAVGTFRYAPRDDDVVVSPLPDGTGRYTLHQVPKAAAVIWPSRPHALLVARAFAKARGVDVWIAEYHVTTRLYRHRPVSI